MLEGSKLTLNLAAEPGRKWTNTISCYWPWQEMNQCCLWLQSPEKVKQDSLWLLALEGSEPTLSLATDLGKIEHVSSQSHWPWKEVIHTISCYWTRKKVNQKQHLWLLILTGIWTFTLSIYWSWKWTNSLSVYITEKEVSQHSPWLLFMEESEPSLFWLLTWEIYKIHTLVGVADLERK
jgi:hypothetical protein